MNHGSSAVNTARKSPTGIAGFDEIVGGGVPRGRVTLLMGGPGSGKTIFGLQFLVHGAHLREAGIFVAFEENSQRIAANAGGFGWKLQDLCRRRQLVFIDAQPRPDLIQSGDFDFSGMLAALEAQTAQIGARRIAFDALDIFLALLPDAAAKRREVYRLHEWLLAHELTALITSKAGGDDTNSPGGSPFGFMQFMVDCAVNLNHGVVLGVSQRNLRVQKYRGSKFDENESPFLIGDGGIQVATARPPGHRILAISKVRVSSGVKRLDTMLGGGYQRGATVLITGFPGTAKTTLSGAFAESACRRGESTLFVSFDAASNEVVRDLTSVGVRLDRHVKSGRLRMISARTVTGSAEMYLVRIKTLAMDQRARCVVVDSISTWSKSTDGLSAHSVAERLIDWSKTNGITLLCTSLLDEIAPGTEGGASQQISTLADTWIHLSYLVQAGERNRGLSVVKSRGTAHSNQVRELILSDAGVTLADAYTAGGDVLMGTLRWEKENAERAAHEAQNVDASLRRVGLDAEEAELEARLKALQTELTAKQLEKALLASTAARREHGLSRGRNRMREMRGADAVTARKR